MSVRPYVVQEYIGDPDNGGRWTSEVPGKTGPYDLEETAHLQDPRFWKVYWVVPIVLSAREQEDR